MTIINPNQVQRLELVDVLFDDVFSGKKKNTKRYNEKEVNEGYLLYEASEDYNLKALVWVTDVESMMLSEVIEKIEEEKHRSLDDLLQRMRSHYPEINLNTKIEVLRHITPLETYVKKGVPDFLLEELGIGYLKKIGATR